MTRLIADVEALYGLALAGVGLLALVAVCQVLLIVAAVRSAVKGKGPLR